MSGYNGGGYPPRPNDSYSPSTPVFGDGSFRPPPPAAFRGAPPPPRPAGFPPFPPTPGGFNAPPTPSFHSPYDEYTPSGPSPPPPKFPPFEPRKSVDSDVYDPYQPSAYNPGLPQLSVPPLSTGPMSSIPVSSIPLSAMPMSAGPRSAMFSSSHSTSIPPRRSGDAPELPLLTSPTTATIGSYTTTVYSLPPSHLPITKYVSVNPGDAIDIHRALCQSGKATSVWYAEGSNRAGEGWGAAVEWVLESGMSGAKLRTCVGMTDSLGTELGAIIKAVEGFSDQLQQSIRTKKPMSHEFVLFCSSTAAIVSIDTSSRPESIQFNHMWREICTEFLQAHLTLVHVPNGSQVDGFILAQKIANVASTNSYTKRRKERTIDDIYNRPGGGDPAPGGSTEAGPWQRGDADPSCRKSPFDRPVPLPVPVPREDSPLPAPIPIPAAPAAILAPSAVPEPEEEPLQPRAGALCVTHFPDHISAKDLGILFAQFGDIQSVDIFSIPTIQSRFAFVAYADAKASGQAAIEALHRKPINLETPFALDNAEDLENWKGFDGVLTIEESDTDRLIPPGVSKYFPGLPDYATTDRRREPSETSKRDRDDQQSPDSPSKKRKISDPEPAPIDLPPHSPHPSDSKPTATPDDPLIPPISLTRADDSPVPSPAKPTISIAEPESPLQLSARTLHAQLNLVQKVFVKHDTSNWIAHSCLIATDLDQARRQLQDDLYATDDASLTSRDVERTLATRGYTGQRIDAFVAKVLKVLDGIALADELEQGGRAPPVEEDLTALAAELEEALKTYPTQTRDAMAAAAVVLEYLHRAKDEQEKKRLEVERRVGVLQGLDKIGEQVSQVVRFLLTDGQ